MKRAFKVRKPEDRSSDEYKEQVDDYLERAAEVLEEVVIDRHLLGGACGIELVVTNPTDWPFREVKIELFIPDSGVHAYDDVHGARIPSPPADLGRPVGSSQFGAPELGTEASPLRISTPAPWLRLRHGAALGNRQLRLSPPDVPTH